jgi:hypothetical protein
MILMCAVKATGTLRISKAGELVGLDIHEHGGSAYPEPEEAFAKAGATSESEVPVGMGIPVAR